MGEVKVIGSSGSLFCTRVEWALKLKGVVYEYIQEDLLNKSKLLLKSNPVHKKIPVLLHDDKPIVESLVILESSMKHGKDTLCCLRVLIKELQLVSGQNLLMRRHAKASSFLDCVCLDPRIYRKRHLYLTFEVECVIGSWQAMQADGEAKAKAIESVQELFAFIEKQIEGKKFFGGAQTGYLDLVMGWKSLWLSAMEEVGKMKLLEPEKFPSLHQWAENFKKIPNT